MQLTSHQGNMDPTLIHVGTSVYEQQNQRKVTIVLKMIFSSFEVCQKSGIEIRNFSNSASVDLLWISLGKCR